MTEIQFEWVSSTVSRCYLGKKLFTLLIKQVTNKTSGKVMVLKMNQQRANRPNMLREVQLMNKLKHPNILGFMGVCVHEGQLHALTEYMEGGSLEQLILSEPPEPLPQALRVSLAADVAEGMMYLHSLGVFHRDLTTKNVLLRKYGEGDYMAVVADFGLAAKIPHPNGYRLPSVGSPWWMSPECLRGRWYDHRSDIFSYGIILCQLIARVDADPDVLPRTDNFGLNYMAFVELCDEDTVPDFLRLTFNCCIYEPKARPLFPEIVNKLAEVKESLDDAAWGSLTNNNQYESEDADSSGPRSCPGLYAWRRPQRFRSEGSPRHHDHEQPHILSPFVGFPDAPVRFEFVNRLFHCVLSAAPSLVVGAGVGRGGAASPFLCGRADDAPAAGGSAERLCEYHILASCCCARYEPAATTSVYTDSSEDVASLTGSDSLYCEERLPRHVRSLQISKIVEYFERKGAEFTCSRSRARPRGGRRARLSVCDGAVRSKLPLFDKKS
ncbi:hypothetical protein B5X24_HaOG206650 [Helicoverpa armigera]|nr:hypothetical protein B5X24_HaOG206650 [Helicoverpa armigera]